MIEITEDLPPAERATALLATLKADEKTDLIELLAASFSEGTSERSLPQRVAVPDLTPKVIEALERLPEVFGKVRVTEPRLLEEHEIKALVEERDTIDAILKVLEKRKDETLRANLANHLDRNAEADGLADPETTPTNKDGHYLVKQDIPVPGTGKKVQGIVSQGKPTVDSARLETLHEDGEISREDYLAITSLPTVRRVFDPAKARKAALKNPSLLLALAKATKKGTQTLTVKVTADT